MKITDEIANMKNTHLMEWLKQGYGHCQRGSKDWCEGYLMSAHDYILALETEIATFTTVTAEMGRIIGDLQSELDKGENTMKITDEMLAAAKSAYWHEVHHGVGYSDDRLRRALEAAIAAASAQEPPDAPAPEAVKDDREAILKRLEMAEKFRDAAILTADESTAKLARLRSDRLYVIGFNEGWEAAKADEHDPRCIACDDLIEDGDQVYNDADGGLIHAVCCGPERASYTGPDGEPLAVGEPIPEPWVWRVATPEPEAERKFALGDRVVKTNGSSWNGCIVGFYSTVLTPIGYCVESEREPGSVQIYPEAALTANADGKQMNEKLKQLLADAKARTDAMSPEEREEMWRRQRESYVRSMTTPCEHGVLDWETCPDCRGATPIANADGK